MQKLNGKNKGKQTNNKKNKKKKNKWTKKHRENETVRSSKDTGNEQVC